MSHHLCQAPTTRAEELQILNAILGTPRNQLTWRYSDRQLMEIEEDAIRLGRDLEAEGRCTDCGHKRRGFSSVRNGMDKALAELWGA
jgi:hypothetical protein